MLYRMNSVLIFALIWGHEDADREFTVIFASSVISGNFFSFFGGTFILFSSLCFDEWLNLPKDPCWLCLCNLS